MKRTVLFLLVAFLLISVISVLPIHGEGAIYDSVIRLHVLANSDSEADQALKLTVRDALLAKTRVLLAEVKTRDDLIRLRLEGGLFADINVPDFETRVGIIKKKAEQYGIVLDENLAFYIAEHIKSNTRQLEGVVKKLEAYINIQNKVPTVAVVQTFIRDIISDDKPEPIQIDNIIVEVAHTYNVSEADILSNRRTASLALARQVAMYIARETTDLSYKAIGESFDKDHTTVLYNVNRIEEFLKDKPSHKELVEDIIKRNERLGNDLNIDDLRNHKTRSHIREYAEDLNYDPDEFSKEVFNQLRIQLSDRVRC